MISPQCTLSKTYCNVNHGKKRPYNGYVRSQREICTTQMPPVQCASVPVVTGSVFVPSLRLYWGQCAGVIHQQVFIFSVILI